MPTAAMMLSGAAAVGGAGNGYYQSLTVDHTKLGSTDLTNYPVLVSLTDANLKSVANGGHVDNTGVFNIWFASTSTGSTSDKIPFEIRKWDAATGQLIAWVLASSVSHTTDTLFGYLRYGAPAQTSDVSNHGGVYDSSFRWVVHGGKNGSVDGNDSTTNGTNANAGTLTLSATAGIIDTAGSIASGAHNYRMVAGSTPSSYGWSVWFKATSSPSGSITFVMTVGSDGIGFAWGHNNAAFKQSPYHQNSGGSYFSGKYATTLVGGTWYLCHSEWDGSSLRTYLNGALENTQTGVTSLRSISSDSISFGAEPGLIEEMRWTANATRGASWILADYNSQNSPSTFVTRGTETAI